VQLIILDLFLIWKFNAVTDVAVFENSNLLNEASIVRVTNINIFSIYICIFFFLGVEFSIYIRSDLEILDLNLMAYVFLIHS
jgi:hypothetical protein